MGNRITLFIVATGALLAFHGAASGQEVNSDVNVPPPRALVSGAPAVNGLVGGTESVFRSSDQVFVGRVAQAVEGGMDEADTRGEIGHFMTSLLVRAGIIAFDSPPAGLADSGKKSEDGSRPAWTGPTPMALSVGQRARSESVRRR